MTTLQALTNLLHDRRVRSTNEIYSKHRVQRTGLSPTSRDAIGEVRRTDCLESNSGRKHTRFVSEESHTKTNPFSDVFIKLGFSKSASIINLVAIIAAVSALNSCIYVAARFIYSLALNNQASVMFTQANKSGVPNRAVVFTLGIAFFAVIANYTFPATILQYLFALITVAIIINWFIIMLSHLMFRRKANLLKKATLFKMPGYPVVNILIIGSLSMILVVMFRNENMKLSVIMAPIWIVLLLIIYSVKNKCTKQI